MTRGYDYEKAINHDYLKKISDAYIDFFYSYTKSPLLIVNTDDFDLSKDDKNYNLLYGFELGFEESKIDDIEDASSKLIEINTQDIALRFTIGVAYGGNKTVGDQGFNHLINSDYIDAIDSFNKFKIKYPKHPKTERYKK